jgi:hypothetical protein
LLPFQWLPHFERQVTLALAALDEKTAEKDRKVDNAEINLSHSSAFFLLLQKFVIDFLQSCDDVSGDGT